MTASGAAALPADNGAGETDGALVKRAVEATRASGKGFHIPSLDGIRALSFFGVFASHLAPETIRVPGPFGVTVFFFLSGYLITTLLRMEAATKGAISLKAFYIRRALRILPPYYCVLAAATLTAFVFHYPLPLLALAAKAMHFANYWIIGHGWDDTPVGTTPYWSLAVEEHFYLVFPTIYLLLSKLFRTGRQYAASLAALCALVLVWRCVLVWGLGASVLRTSLASDTRVDSILFGCCLATFGNPMLDGPSRIAPGIWKWLLFPAACLLTLFTFTFHDLGLRETVRYSLQGIALFPVFIAAIRFPAWGPFRVLNLRPLRFIGTLSYSLYLLHDVVLSVLRDQAKLDPLWRGVVGFPISCALAYGIYVWIEKPCATLRRRWARAE
jgi:peptidoglycan/LPS O-acetylase OafA/YrhL